MSEIQPGPGPIIPSRKSISATHRIEAPGEVKLPYILRDAKPIFDYLIRTAQATLDVTEREIALIDRIEEHLRFMREHWALPGEIKTE